MTKVEFASAVNIRSLREEADELLRAIAKYMIEPGESIEDWAESTFVSDESQVGDSLSRDADVQLLARDLDLPMLRRQDRMYEVAAILHQRKLPN